MAKCPTVLLAPLLVHLLRCFAAVEMLTKLGDGLAHLVKANGSAKGPYKLVAEFSLVQVLDDFSLTERLGECTSCNCRIMAAEIGNSLGDPDHQVRTVLRFLCNSKMLP